MPEISFSAYCDCEVVGQGGLANCAKLISSVCFEDYTYKTYYAHAAAIPLYYLVFVFFLIILQYRIIQKY